MKLKNAVEISQELIKIPSYSGKNDEVIKLMEDYLITMGFKCDIIEYDGDGSYPVNNIHAILNPNNSENILYFAGHTDVVNEGNKDDWKYDPFTPTIEGDKLYGRGACDMKCAIACFISAVDEYLSDPGHNKDFGIGFLITNDEEADGVNGTKKVLKWMEENNYKIPNCIVGEPTNPSVFGEMAKIGRRGSASFKISITGKQGHVAYPHNACNPITILINLLKTLKDHKFDEGNENFDPTNLEVTSITSQNLGGNVIPNTAEAAFNIRFNNIHTPKDITDLIEYVCQKTVGSQEYFGATYKVEHRVSGDSFLTKPGKLSEITAQSMKEITGIDPDLSTTGGTSDARFIKDYASEFLELGLINETAHKVDEFSKVSEINQLQKTYLKILQKLSNE